MRDKLSLKIRTKRVGVKKEKMCVLKIQYILRDSVYLSMCAKRGDSIKKQGQKVSRVFNKGKLVPI